MLCMVANSQLVLMNINIGNLFELLCESGNCVKRCVWLKYFQYTNNALQSKDIYL